MIVRSYDAVCWYEALKQFPNTNVSMFKECGGQAQFTLDSNFDSGFEWPSDDDNVEKFNQTVVSKLQTKHRSINCEINSVHNIRFLTLKKDTIRNAFEQSPLVKIPKAYLENCVKYLIVREKNYEHIKCVCVKVILILFLFKTRILSKTI